MTKKVTCEECGARVEMTIQCIPGCDMYLCSRCTLQSPKHDSTRGEHPEIVKSRSDR